MTKTKNYLFNNFNKQTHQSELTKNELSIINSFNVDTSSHKIKPTFNFSNYFKKNLSHDNYSTFLQSNLDLINRIVFVLPFDYYDNFSHKYINRLFVVLDSFELYELDLEFRLTYLNYNFTKIPEYFYEDEKLLLIDSNSLFVVIEKNDPPYAVTDYPNLVNFCKALDRSFITTADNKFSVFENENTNLINLTSSVADYQELYMDFYNGEVQNIFEFNNYLIVVQQYQISKITYSNNNYKTLSTNYFNSKIFANTCKRFNDCVVFLTSSGLYLYDGNDTKQIFYNISKNIDFNSSFSACAFNDKYYLCADCFIDEIKERVILEFDIQNDYVTVHKLNQTPDFIYVVKTPTTYELCVSVFSNNEHNVLSFDNHIITTCDKIVKFNKINFDSNNFKTLKSINIIAGGEFDLTVSNGRHSLTYHCLHDTKIRNLGLKGQFFEFEIKSKKSFIIECINFEIESVEED